MFRVTRSPRSNAFAGTPLWAVRWSARAPLVIVLLVGAVLAAAGVRTLLQPQPITQRSVTGERAPDLGAHAFAEDFARTYLTWDARKSQAYERAVTRFLAADVDPAAGLVLPHAGSQRVLWSAVVGERRSARGRRIVTIAADTNHGRVHLAVSVGRDQRGMLFVTAPPAIVGPPATTTKASAGPEDEVEDRALRAVAARVVRNFLAGERDDLAADLDPSAVISLPEQRLTVRSTDAVIWVAKPRRVAVAVTASERGGPRLALRYELAVLRRGGRWLVRVVHTNPIVREGGP
jgi:hypothetical protein